MITAKDMALLEVGDHFEHGTPLQGLSSKELTFTVTAVEVSGGDVLEATFLVTYFGVGIGKWVARPSATQVDWEKL